MCHSKRLVFEKSTKIYTEQLNKLVLEALDRILGITISSTSFGLSLYIDYNGIKMRFSDHSVTSFDRIVGEDHYELTDLFEKPNYIKKNIEANFSDKYQWLTLSDDDHNITYKLFRVLKTEKKNWEKVIIKLTVPTEYPFAFEKIKELEKNGKLISKGDLTKKQNKQFVKYLKDYYYLGVVNNKTGETEYIYTAKVYLSNLEKYNLRIINYDVKLQYEK